MEYRIEYVYLEAMYTKSQWTFLIIISQLIVFVLSLFVFHKSSTGKRGKIDVGSDFYDVLWRTFFCAWKEFTGGYFENFVKIFI